MSSFLLSRRVIKKASSDSLGRRQRQKYIEYAIQYDLLEQPIYGSDRLGQSTHSLTLSSSATYSALMQPANGAAIQSEYENWLTTTNKSQLLSGTTDNLCQCKVMSITNSTVNPNYSAVSTAVEFLGIANNGIAVAEDLEGKLQFYAVLAKKYLGNADACLIFDKDGKLMKGTENVGTIDVNSKPIIVNVPGTKLYNVITLDANKQPVYHTVDMNQFGYGPVNAEGVVISVNQPMSNNTNTAVTNGFHFTAMENHVNAQAVVYTSRFTPDPLDNTKGTTEILAYDFGSGAVSPQEYLLHSIYGCGNTETGELQISPNGNKLAWYQHDKTISGFKTRTGYIYTMPLSPTKIALNGTVAVHPISNAGNYGNGALEFMTNSDDILYAQRGMYKEGLGSQKYDKNVWKYDPISLSDVAINPDNLLSPVNVSYLFGEIKRGTDGRFYIPNMGAPADKIHSYTGAAWTGTVNVNQAAYQFASALPTQVWKLFADPTQTLSEYPRNIGRKDYELKDHLGNVRVVISDEKVISDNNTNNLVDNTDDFTPNVRTYSAYYPFGQLMPGQRLNSGDYRFGYNGKENDNEIKGDGNVQDYGMRMLDVRLAKFLSADPLWREYPWYTPYQYAGNKPIRFIDRDGAEEWDNSGTVTPYIRGYTYNKDLNDIPKFLANNIAFALYNAASGLINALPAAYKYTTNPNNSFSSDVTAGFESISHADRDLNNWVFNTSTTQKGRDIANWAKQGLNSFTQLENYDLAFQMLLFHKLSPTLKTTPLAAEMTLLQKRTTLARDFFTKSNVNNIEGHMAAINFDQQVYTEILPEGAKLYRFTEIGTTQPKHYFFKDLGVHPDELGKLRIKYNPEKYILEEYTLKKPVKVLNSTVDLGGETGAKQVFSTEVEGASSVEQGALDGSSFNADSSAPH